MKKTQLTEKPSRIPDILEQNISQKFKEYSEYVSQLNTESAKAQRFLILLKDIFGDVNAGFIEDYLHGVEKYVSVKQKDIILRGRIDTLYGNLIIEFENDLRKKLDDAVDQLKRYTSYLLQSGEKATYLCMATDGILFYVYSPRIKGTNEIELEEIDKIDVTKAEPYQAYSWIDRYFFRKTVLHPKTEEKGSEFGLKSPAFKNSLNIFNRIMYKPLFLKEKFDVVIGNPPWLSYRYVDKGEYQKFLKNMIVDEYKLLSGVSAGEKMKVKAELITHMELATLFFLRTADLYLKDRGLIGFVMPRSLFTADQHNTFRRQQYSRKIGFTEIWDMEKIKPLFNVPACVFIAKKGTTTASPYKAEFISGILERKNAELVDAEKSLTVNEGNLYVSAKGERSFLSASEEGYIEKQRSLYHSLFKQGATIVPRNFWFVDIKSHPKLGFNPSAPYVETSEASEKTAKEAYKGILLKGNIEKDFLYATLLSTDIVPFGYLDYRIVVLPLIQENEGYTIIKESEAGKKGFINLSKWIHKAQKIWEEKRGEKAEKMDIYQRLDRIRGMTGQTPTSK